MRLLFGVFLCFFSFTDLVAQPYNFEEEFKNSFSQKPKFEFKFDSRFSFLRNTEVKTTGVKIGLSFNRKFNVGLGVNKEQTQILELNLDLYYMHKDVPHPLTSET